MDQAEIDQDNRFMMATFLKRIARGEVIAAVVTVRADGKGIGWYPALEKQSGVLLDLLRTKPDEIHIERRT